MIHLSASSQDNGIWMVGNCTDLCLNDSLLICHEELPETFDSIRVVLLFSGSESLDTEEVTRLTRFLEDGGGLYLGADNAPLQTETNQLTTALFNKSCYGEFSDSTASTNSVNGNLKLKEMEQIPAGTTTSAFPMDHRLKVEAWVEDEPLILSGSWKLGRIIIDGGYSRFYCAQRSEASDQLLGKFIFYLRREEE